MSISLQVIGALGGATKQAVSHARNPKRWLQTRIRRRLVPVGDERAFYGAEIRKHTRVELASFIKEAQERVCGLPTPQSGTIRGGRPVKRNPEALAAFLGVSWQEGDGLWQVFVKFAAECLKGLYRDVLPLIERERHIWGDDLTKLLDAHWLPRFRERAT